MESTYQKTTNILSGDFETEEEMKNFAYNNLIISYNGYDIIEVICREASIISLYENLNSIFVNKRMFSYSEYLKNIARAASKYAQSNDWPQVETTRAKALRKYVLSEAFVDGPVRANAPD